MDTYQTLLEAARFTGDAEACLLPVQTKAGGATDSAAIDMSGYGSVLFIVPLGAANAADTTITAEVLQSDDGGVTSKALAGVRGAKLSATITAGAGFATYNGLILITVRAEEMDINNGYEWLECRLTVSAQDTWITGVIAARYRPNYEPVDNFTYTTDIED